MAKASKSNASKRSKLAAHLDKYKKAPKSGASVTETLKTFMASSDVAFSDQEKKNIEKIIAKLSGVLDGAATAFSSGGNVDHLAFKLTDGRWLMFSNIAEEATLSAVPYATAADYQAAFWEDEQNAGALTTTGAGPAFENVEAIAGQIKNNQLEKLYARGGKTEYQKLFKYQIEDLKKKGWVTIGGVPYYDTATITKQTQIKDEGTANRIYNEVRKTLVEKNAGAALGGEEFVRRYVNMFIGKIGNRYVVLASDLPSDHYSQGVIDDIIRPGDKVTSVNRHGHSTAPEGVLKVIRVLRNGNYVVEKVMDSDGQEYVIGDDEQIIVKVPFGAVPNDQPVEETIFSIEGDSPEEDKQYRGYYGTNPAYSFGEAPLFDRATTEKILKDADLQFRVNTEGAIQLLSEGYEDIELPVHTVSVGGKPVQAYDFSALGWTWSKAFAAGGEVKRSRRFTGIDFDKLTDEKFNAVRTGDVWEVYDNETKKKVAVWSPDKETLRLVGKSEALIQWLKSNSYLHSSEFAAGGEVTHSYKLGDKWRSDFDYEGMLKMATQAEVSWGAKKLEKLYNSLVDVNFHAQARLAWDAVQALKANNQDEAKALIEQLHASAQTELGELNEGFAAGGVVKLSKDQKTTIFLAGVFLATYKWTFKEGQNGRVEIEKVLKGLKETPTDASNLVMAVLLLKGYQETVKDANITQSTNEVIAKLERMIKLYQTPTNQVDAELARLDKDFDPKVEKALYKETALAPQIIADGVALEAFEKNEATKHLPLDQRRWDLTQALASYLYKKTIVLYKTNERFKKQLQAKGNKGRDTLYTFMQHWAEAYLGKAKFDLGGVIVQPMTPMPIDNTLVASIGFAAGGQLSEDNGAAVGAENFVVMVTLTTKLNGRPVRSWSYGMQAYNIAAAVARNFTKKISYKTFSFAAKGEVEVVGYMWPVTFTWGGKEYGNTEAKQWRFVFPGSSSGGMAQQTALEYVKTHQKEIEAWPKKKKDAAPLYAQGGILTPAEREEYRDLDLRLVNLQELYMDEDDENKKAELQANIQEVEARIHRLERKEEYEADEAAAGLTVGDSVVIVSEQLSANKAKFNGHDALKKIYAQLLHHIDDVGQVEQMDVHTAQVSFGGSVVRGVPKELLQALPKEFSEGGSVGDGYTDLSYVTPAKITFEEKYSFGRPDKLLLKFNGKIIARFYYNMRGYNADFSLKNIEGTHAGFGGDRSKAKQISDFKNWLKQGYTLIKHY